jgi:ABC-type spermidine/putrescine transport system permease subunit I
VTVAPPSESDPQVQRPARRAGRLARHALLLPSGAWTLLFFLGPMVLLVVYSLGTIDLLTFQVSFGWTLSNYSEVFSDLYMTTVGRSLLLSTGATLGCLLVGFPLAYAISRQRGRWQTFLLVAVMIPFWTSFVVRTYGLVNLLDDKGPLADLLGWLGIAESVHLLYTPWGIAIGMVYTYLPLMVLPLFVALERIDPSLLSAARDLGTPPRRVFRRIVLPLAAPGIVAGCVLVGVPATGEYVVPEILGGGKTLMYGNVVASQFEGLGNYPFGSALAVTLTALVTVIVFVSRRRAQTAAVLG